MPHEKVRIENKRKVVQAATKLFVENDIDKTSIDMIAAEVGITTRSIQNYYETKLDLICDVYKTLIEEKIATANAYYLEEAYRKLSGIEQIVAAMEYSMRYVVGDAPTFCLFQKMKQQLLREKRLRLTQYDDISALLGNALQQAMIKGVQDGSVRADALAEKTDMLLLLMSLSGIQGQLAFWATIPEMQSKIQEENAVENALKRMKDYIYILYGTGAKE